MKSSQRTGCVRRRFLSLVFVLFFGASGIALPRLAAAAAAPTPLTAESLQLLVSQNKVTPAQAKILQADLDLIAAAQQKIAEFKKLPPDQLRNKANVLKYDAMMRELSLAQNKLANDQLKLTPVRLTPTPKPRGK